MNPGRTLILSVAIVCISLSCAVSSARATSAAYVVFDDQTGVVLAEHGMSAKRPIASLTKIATAMVVIDWTEVRGGRLDDVATVPAEALAFGGPNPMNLAVGERLSLRDLLYAALLQSDNLSAYTAAYHVGSALRATAGPGSDLGRMNPEQAFVFQMNELCKRLRMGRTHFSNPHGLEVNGQRPGYSCAADLGRLTRYAIARPAFRFFVSQVQRTVQAGGRGYCLRNTNPLLGQDGIDGVKTGTTRSAGDCVILSSMRSPESRQMGNTVVITPRRVTVVVLASTDRFGEGLGLIRQGWKLYEDWSALGRPTDRRKILDLDPAT
jgi:serine-type D-Ala-D-Ala carboxypeptidase (penicillin-binding protein 5/6)